LLANASHHGAITSLGYSAKTFSLATVHFYCDEIVEKSNLVAMGIRLAPSEAVRFSMKIPSHS